METLEWMKEASGPLKSECKVIGWTLLVLWFLSFVAIFDKNFKQEKGPQ